MSNVDMDRVYILESPSPEDLYNSRCEGRALYEALRLAETDVTYHLAASVEMFKEGLRFVVDDFFAKSGKWSTMPFIHISAHGDSNGIQLTDGDYFLWEDFREELKNINEKIGYVPGLGKGDSKFVSRLVLCFSTCEGFDAHKIHAEDPCPFQFLVGPISIVTWPDSLTAFQVFYHAANHRGEPFLDALNLMNKAAGLDNVFNGYASPELNSMANDS